MDVAAWMVDGWIPIAGVALSTAAMFAATLASVRLAGRRTIAQLSAFDAVVTVALGSIVATTVVAPEPAVLEGLTAIVVLLVLQVVVGWMRQRFVPLRRFLDFAPEAVVQQGTVRLPTGPLSSQLTEDELRSRLRVKGYRLEDVSVVLLEPTGDLAVLAGRRSEG